MPTKITEYGNFFPEGSKYFGDFGQMDDFCVSILDYFWDTEGSMYYFVFKKITHAFVNLLYCCYSKYGSKRSLTKFIT